jgi:hypothetical protein
MANYLASYSDREKNSDDVRAGYLTDDHFFDEGFLSCSHNMNSVIIIAFIVIAKNSTINLKVLIEIL